MSGSLPQGNLKLLETLFRLPLPLQRESCLFLIVNVLDVLMTCLLLNDVLGGRRPDDLLRVEPGGPLFSR